MDDSRKDSAGNALLSDLFELVDEKAWEHLAEAAKKGQLSVKRGGGRGDEQPEAFDPVVL